MINFHYVYVLQSGKDRSHYVGYSDNLQKRLREHNLGLNSSTKPKIPWIIIYAEAYLNKADALGREKFLKGGSGKMYLKKQLKHFLEESLPAN